MAIEPGQIEHVFREERGRILATLIRFVGEIDVAEEALAAAFEAALVQWPAEGLPDNPRAWLVRASRNPAYKYCLALETLNGRGSEKENEFSRRLCELMAMPATAGTDAHALADIGRCATHFERDIRSLEDLIDELKAGRFRPIDLRSTTPK